MKKNSAGSAPRSKTRQVASQKATAKLTVGIDLGDQNSAYCMLDTAGDVLPEGTIHGSVANFGAGNLIG